eukprot:6656557-Karenia_brevis.AAC.1
MQQRMGAFDGLQGAVLEDLHKMLIYDAKGNGPCRIDWKRAYNPYARRYMYMHELLRGRVLAKCSASSLKRACRLFRGDTMRLA